MAHPSTRALQRVLISAFGIALVGTCPIRPNVLQVKACSYEDAVLARANSGAAGIVIMAAADAELRALGQTVR